MLDPRFRRGRKLIEARCLLSVAGRRSSRAPGQARLGDFLEGTLGGAIPGHMVSVIRRHRRGDGFSGEPPQEQARPLALRPYPPAAHGRGTWRHPRPHRAHDRPPPVRRDGRKLRHGAGLGAALFRHVRASWCGGAMCNSQARGHLLDARFGSGGKIVEGWFRWRRGVHRRACGRGCRRPQPQGLLSLTGAACVKWDASRSSLTTIE